MTTSLLDHQFSKPAPADFPIHDLLRSRWSPRSFSDATLSVEELSTLFEAARWSASAFNEQPSFFMVGQREDRAQFDRMLDCLTPGNRIWAQHAATLVFTVAREDFASKPGLNRTALYDLGQAVANLVFQATAMGIAVHQMAGVDLDMAREVCAIPAGFQPVTAIAIGRPAPTENLPEAVRAKDMAPRKRKAQKEFVFGPTWNQPAIG